MAEKNSSNFVDKAEKVIESLTKNGQIDVTTNQLRKFLSAVNSVNNKLAITMSKLPPNSPIPKDEQEDILMLKVNMIYQIGKNKSKSSKEGSSDKKGKGNNKGNGGGKKENNPVKEFAERAGIIQEIDKIGSDYKKFLQFYRYMEALVAYHKLYSED